MEGGTIKHVKRLLVLLITSLLISSTLPVGVISAETPNTSSILISQIQAGAVGDATQEYISLYNNTNQEINITDWCISNKTSDFVCIKSAAQNEVLYVSAYSFVRISSESFETAHIDFRPDASYASANRITASSDTISLKNENGIPIDSVSWVKTLSPGSHMQRLALNESDVLLDTNTESDFQQLLELVIPPSGVSEVVITIDVCPNIEGEQPQVPNGFLLTGGICLEDVTDLCPNISGLQVEIPIGFLLDGAGECRQDQCSNLEGLQLIVPDRYIAVNYSCTKAPLAVVRITELLPNPSGSDMGAEYIELYNPNEFSVNMQHYRLRVGPNFEKTYEFPADANILPLSYYIIPTSVGYTLVNTSSRVQLIGDDDEIIDQTPIYANPADNQAWALIDDIWQFTNRPTSGYANMDSSIDDAETYVSSTAILAPCGEGKYRNPLTNRCRNIVADVAVLASCGADEYRNPETNRCRKIVTATSSLTPCSSDQERNPETNRCRAVASSSVLAACKEGQERNPETNRCRNSVSAANASKTAYAVTPTNSSGGAKTGWIIAGLAATAAIGYGAYEWRREIGKFVSGIIPGKK